MKRLSRLSIILIGLVLLPTIVYIVFEVRRADQQQRSVADQYQGILETLLFSVDQHVLDTSTRWASELEDYLDESTAPTDSAVQTFLRSRPYAIDAAVIVTKNGDARWFRRERSGDVAMPVLSDSAQATLHERLSLDYRQLLPTRIDVDGEMRDALMFALRPKSRGVLGGIVVSGEQLVNKLLVPKLQDVARQNFGLCVSRMDPAAREPDRILYSTGRIDCVVTPFRRGLSVFPGYVIAIQPESAQSFRGRTIRNLLMIAAMTAVLLLGAVMAVRSLRQEMRLAQMKSDFVSNVSHELRTPLSLIRLFAETLELGRVRDDAKRQEYYRTIRTETERLTLLINNILDFSQMEAGKKRFTFEKISINSCVMETLRLYEYKLAEAGFRVETELDSKLPLVTADHGAVTEVLLNLIENAIKYSPNEKYMRISTEPEGDGVSIRIRDRGQGIEASEHERIFEKFYRVSSGLVHDAKGSGLGLTLVRYLMAGHGGTVSVASPPDEGTEFVLYFPAESNQDGSKP